MSLQTRQIFILYKAGLMQIMNHYFYEVASEGKNISETVLSNFSSLSRAFG